MGDISDIIDDLNVPPTSGEFEPLPPGKYLAQVVDHVVKETKSGNGKYLTVTWEILDESHKGRKIFNNFNILNPNEKAQAIARGQLSALAKACGLSAIPEKGADLWGIPHYIKLGLDNPTPGYQQKNIVKGFYLIGEESQEKKGKLPDKVKEVPLAEDTLPNSEFPY